MEIIITILVALAFMVLLLFALAGKRAKKLPGLVILEKYKPLLKEHVQFYQKLNDTQKKEFESRIQLFLSHVRITGVNAVVTDLDRVLIASSAIIPIFGFPGWEYTNLNEVLLYPDSFNQDFEQKGNERNYLGLVGDGAFQDIMILSQHELRQDFLNSTARSNTAIHEFVHLLDKTDGSVDGIPELMLPGNYVIPWLDLMQRKIKQIQANRSDINPYGAASKAEFFAVASEYFFERPDLLSIRHPELFKLLSAIFRQELPGSGD